MNFSWESGVQRGSLGWAEEVASVVEKASLIKELACATKEFKAVLSF